MTREFSGLSVNLFRTCFLAVVMATAMTLVPKQAHARALVCAPNGRGCFWSRLTCDKIDRPKTWTCTNKLVVSGRKDHVFRENNGRAAVVVDGKKVYLLSDAFERQIMAGKVKGNAFADLVFKDNGPAAEETLQVLSKELNIPVVKEAAIKNKVR